MRRACREVKVGRLSMGGNAPISVQSMLSCPSGDVEGNVHQARELEEAGCDVIRVSVPTQEDVRLIEALKGAVETPIVADIHFNHRIALECAAAGVDKIRINPGNIGSDDRVRQVAAACRERGIPIRIGVNSGSLEPEILKKYGAPTPQAMCESALYHIGLLERCDFEDIVVSLKSSSVPKMVEAYQLLASQCRYPLHLGVTEAGSERMGLIKSAAGIGSLLLQGIGDTIRISLTDLPVKEVAAGRDILKGLELRHDSPTVISCPTCGRTKIDLIAIAREVEEKLAGCKKPLQVAVMGCAVNGPGEAREADIGIAGGDGYGILIKKGEILRKVPEDCLVEELMKEIDGM